MFILLLICRHNHSHLFAQSRIDASCSLSKHVFKTAWYICNTYFTYIQHCLKDADSCVTMNRSMFCFIRKTRTEASQSDNKNVDRRLFRMCIYIEEDPLYIYSFTHQSSLQTLPVMNIFNACNNCFFTAITFSVE